MRAFVRRIVCQAAPPVGNEMSGFVAQKIG
jgi:hypothetical protein